MQKVLGNTDGLKNNIISALEQLYECKVPAWQLISPELVAQMAAITTAVNREVNVFLDRKGNVLSVSIGDSNTVSLPDLPGRSGIAVFIAGNNGFHVYTSFFRLNLNLWERSS